ncbi:MAG: hypothetical protein A4E64_00283 [Syntrophorhabdus sp. PtaU1.Bin058]|nr:MAG: hypothetical protein A4E64_00283 [Syntrophorhabdus sp. PtaU1.Bin058]
MHAPAVVRTILFLLFLPTITFAVDCNRPPSGFGGSWARAYKQWCESCCGTFSSSGPSCNPGPNWGCRQQGGGGGSSYDYEAERQRQEAERRRLLEAERQRQQELEEQRRREEAEAKRRQEEFDRNKQEALRSMKGIAEGELGLKGTDASGDLGLKDLDSGKQSLGLKDIGETGTGELGLKTLFDKGSPNSAPVDTRAKGPSKLDVGKDINISVIKVQVGVDKPTQFRKDLLNNFSDTIVQRTAQPNVQAQEILRSFKTKEPPSPVKNIDNLAAGDIILVAPWPKKDLKKAGLWEVGVSNGINLMDRWGSGNWSSPASHAAIFLGERNGKRWYMDNTGKGPIIKEEQAFLKEYGARKMDVATLVGQPLSQHEGEEMWKGAHELRNTTTYWPSGVPHVGSSDTGMVCSEASRWLLVRAGRRVPETQSANAKVSGVDTGLNKKQFVNFSPSDFYENQQYFVVHQLSLYRKGDKKQ